MGKTKKMKRTMLLDPAIDDCAVGGIWECFPSLDSKWALSQNKICGESELNEHLLSAYTMVGSGLAANAIH